MRFDGRGLGMLLLGLVLLALGCHDVVVAPTSLVYSTNPAVYTVGKAISANTPSHSGGDIVSYSVSPALPGGLSLNTTSGVISGTPTVASAQAIYTVTATNTGGTATASLTITVNAAALPITISTQPTSQTVPAGLTATFRVLATGTGTLSYQWQKNGAAIATGGNSASYTTPAVTMADSGSTFAVVITDNTSATLTSATATLTVTAGGPSTFSSTIDGLYIGRTYHTATLLNTGMILIVGGTDLSASLGTAELYDPATDTFTYTGSLVNARQKHTATLLSDGKVLIVGGIAGAGGSTTLTTAEIYDPATGSFGLTFASPVAARSEHSATLLQNGKVLIVSGRDQGNYVSTAEIYDPSTGQFTLTPSAPLAARATHTATLLSSGKVLIAGGFHAGALTSAELYDPAAGTFTATGTLTTPRAAQTATLLQSGKVLIVGGASVLTAELFDPNAGTNGDFTDATGSLNTARVYGHTATLLPSGSVLITGGIGAGSPAPVLANAELFDPVAQTFTQTAGLMTTAREHHTGNLLSTGKVFICGGDAGTVLASAEVYY